MAMCFNIVEHAFIGYGPVFDNLGKPAEEFFPEQCVQHIQVADNKLRLIENAHNVFIAPEIDPVFAAHAGIDLG